MIFPGVVGIFGDQNRTSDKPIEISSRLHQYLKSLWIAERMQSFDSHRRSNLPQTHPHANTLPLTRSPAESIRCFSAAPLGHPIPWRRTFTNPSPGLSRTAKLATLKLDGLLKRQPKREATVMSHYRDWI